MVAIFSASTKGGGMCFAFPDVCLTPAPPAPSPIPIPYPNIGQVNSASKTSSKVKFSGKEACTMKSELGRSSGDEPGTNKGIASGTNMDKVTWKVGVSKVKVEGSKVVRHLMMTGQNGSSANMPAGTQVAPSQTKVIVAP